jgi:uncharacterized protein YndB with AHSA1/START domain
MPATDTRITVPTDTPTVTMQRLFHAPPARVFAALTTPALLERWYGPRRYRTEVPELDLRVGGCYRFLNIGADGTVYGFHGEYREVVPDERLVDMWIWEGEPDQVVIETSTLEERDGGTLLTVTAEFPDFASRESNQAEGGSEGAIESWERLEEVLASME